MLAVSTVVLALLFFDAIAIFLMVIAASCFAKVRILLTVNSVILNLPLSPVLLFLNLSTSRAVSLVFLCTLYAVASLLLRRSDFRSCSSRGYADKVFQDKTWSDQMINYPLLAY